MLDLHNGKLRQAVNAPKLDAIPMTRSFMAALLRRASGADEAEVKALVEVAVSAERETIQRRIDHQVKRMTERSAEAIESWVDDKELGAAIRIVVESGALASYGSLTALRSRRRISRTNAARRSTSTNRTSRPPPSPCLRRWPMPTPTISELTGRPVDAWSEAWRWSVNAVMS
ncbi:MAG: hypothetical protein WBA48_18185 [Xanthobacteraceae bacterium]